MKPLTNGGNDWEHVFMHRVVTLNTLCSIASIYFVTQPTFELINYFIFRKVLRNVFSGEVGKLTIS